MTNSTDLLARRDAVMPRGIPKITPLAVSSAQGATLTTLEGRKVLDFATGIGVALVGHSHPDVVAAVCRQAEALQHTCIHVATYEPYVALCERLVELFPHGEATKAMLLNSGAEAVENAIKIARQATGRPGVLCYTESFHGRTLLTMSLTSKVGYKMGCGPFAPEVYRLPYPNHYLYGEGLSESDFVERELWRLRRALSTTVPASNLAAILLEVVQGEGGFVPCPLDYLRGLRSLCDEHGILLIVDEVQTGFGRTGRWAAYEHAGITPDLSTWAKALGGGLPVSAVVGRAQVMDGAAPGTLGGTYGGNPVACAAACAAIDVMKREDVCVRAQRIGAVVESRFAELHRELAHVGDVRGLGAMRAIEFSYDRDPRQPAAPIAAKVTRASLEQGLLLLTTGIDGNVVRLLPPLLLDAEELQRGMDILCEQARVAVAQA